MLNNKYETRIVAYADILGWREATKDMNKFYRLHKAVTSIANHASLFSSKVKEKVKMCGVEEFYKKYEDVEFSYFSDSLAISVSPDYGEFLFKILSVATEELLHEHFLVRGGVAIGELYHCQGLVFGPALNEAVEIEREEAFYPRFICSQKLLGYLNGMPYRDEVVLQDCCQEWVVNIACESSINYDNLLKLIEKGSQKSERIMRKWRYLQIMLPKMVDIKFKQD